VQNVKDTISKNQLLTRSAQARALSKKIISRKNLGGGHLRTI